MLLLRTGRFAKTKLSVVILLQVLVVLRFCIKSKGPKVWIQKASVCISNMTDSNPHSEYATFLICLL